ncbi:MAG: NAD(P)H-binding protein [Pseudomonadota bacterium]
MQTTKPVYSLSLRLLSVGLIALLCACATPRPDPLPVPPAPSKTQQVTIAMLGATGLAGSYILNQALAQGYNVRVLARTPSKLERYAGRIAVVKGDARDSETIAELLRGADVVVSALGPVKADGDGAKMINSSVTADIIRQMPDFGIERYIMVSGAAVLMPGDDRDASGWLMRELVQLRLRSELVDKQAEYEELAQSSVDWTLVRCPLIEPEPFAAAPIVSLTTPPAWSVRAGDLAYFVVEQIESDEYVRKGPMVGSR